MAGTIRLQYEPGQSVPADAKDRAGPEPDPPAAHPEESNDRQGDPRAVPGQPSTECGGTDGSGP
eukprot:4863542-Heterocapsa_arctica.AAC.1